MSSTLTRLVLPFFPCQDYMGLLGLRRVQLKIHDGEKYALLYALCLRLPENIITSGSAHDVKILKERNLMANRVRKPRIVSLTRTAKVLRGGNGLVYDAFWRWLLIPN